MVAATALRAGRALTGRFDPDEFQHLHGGWCLAHGLWPYRDYFEHHTPWFWLALAPFLALFGADRDPDRAVAFVLAARGVMWVLGTAALYLTFRLGRTWGGARTGWLAAALLGATLAFVDKSIEIRPDVPALVCLLGSWLVTATAWQRDPGDRGARWRLGLAGLLLGSAILFTQKVVFTLPATSVLFVWWVARPPGPRRARVIGLAAFAAGLAVPVAATLCSSPPIPGSPPSWSSTCSGTRRGRCASLPSPPAAHLRCEPGPGGPGAPRWLRAAARPPRTPPRGSAFLVLQTAGLIAGAFILPVPQLHYFLMVLPLIALLAARLISELIEAVARGRGAPTGALAPAAAALVLALAAGPPLAAGFQTLGARDPRMQDQLARLRLVLTLTTAKDTVFDGFTGAGAFRPHAYFYFFLHDEIRALLEGRSWTACGALRDGEIAPRWSSSTDVQDLSPEIKSFVEENYEPAGDPLVWRRKDLALDGPSRAAGSTSGGDRPRSSSGAAGGPRRRKAPLAAPAQGLRSTLRVPLLLPADLVVTVRAQSEAATADARLGLVVNDRPCGSALSPPGGATTPFACRRRWARGGEPRATAGPRAGPGRRVPRLSPAAFNP